MSFITISQLPLDNVPAGPLQFSITWRKLPDPDVPASYTLAPVVTVDTQGNVISPVPYKIAVPATPIILKASNVNGCGVGITKEFFICEPVMGVFRFRFMMDLYISGDFNMIGTYNIQYTLNGGPQVYFNSAVIVTTTQTLAVSIPVYQGDVITFSITESSLRNPISYGEFGVSNNAYCAGGLEFTRTMGGANDTMRMLVKANSSGVFTYC